MDVWFCSRAGINGPEATALLILIRSMRALPSAPTDTCAFLLTFDLHGGGQSGDYPVFEFCPGETKAMTVSDPSQLTSIRSPTVTR